jgi:hypothetical protein
LTWRRNGRVQNSEVDTVSIVRIGLAETKKFAEGYEAIFGKKKEEKQEKEEKPKTKEVPKKTDKKK